MCFIAGGIKKGIRNHLKINFIPFYTEAVCISLEVVKSLIKPFKDINKIVTSKYNVVVNNDNSGTTNRMNTTWTSSNVPKVSLNVKSATYFLSW